MTEATQTATPTDARQASMSRVQTQDTVLATLTAKAASEPAEGQKPDAEKSKDEGDQKPKSASDRIRELASKRREAEEKAEAAERKARELEAKVQALEAGAKPMEAGAKPMRAQYASDDEYIEALSDWKAREAIAKREQEQAQARIEAEQAEIAERWTRRQDKVAKAIPDYEEVVRSSNVNFPDYVFEDLMESDYGPQIVYFLALNPDEAKSLAQMKRSAATRRIAALERDMADIEKDDGKPAKEAPKKAEETPKPQRSKAPEPIEPVKSVPSSTGTSSSNFEEYRRRRLAEKRR